MNLTRWTLLYAQGLIEHLLLKHPPKRDTELDRIRRQLGAVSTHLHSLKSLLLRQGDVLEQHRVQLAALEGVPHTLTERRHDHHKLARRVTLLEQQNPDQPDPALLTPMGRERSKKTEFLSLVIALEHRFKVAMPGTLAKVLVDNFLDAQPTARRLFNLYGMLEMPNNTRWAVRAQHSGPPPYLRELRETLRYAELFEGLFTPTRIRADQHQQESSDQLHERLMDMLGKKPEEGPGIVIEAPLVEKPMLPLGSACPLGGEHVGRGLCACGHQIGALV